MKIYFYPLILITLFAPLHSFSQSTMNLHMNNGTTESFNVNDIDSITYNNNTGVNYSIGDNGPAGGYVVYDKGSYSFGWRYIELSPNDLNSSEADGSCAGNVSSSMQSGIGNGRNNTMVLVDQCGSDPSAASTVCYNYLLINDGVNYDDWYLPNIQEFTLIYNVFVSMGKPNSWLLKDDTNFWHYWTSSYINSIESYGIRLSDGNVSVESSNETHYVRAIRYF